MRKQYLFIWSFSPTWQLSQVLTQTAGSFMPQTVHIEMMASSIADIQNQNFMAFNSNNSKTDIQSYYTAMYITV